MVAAIIANFRRPPRRLPRLRTPYIRTPLHFQVTQRTYEGCLVGYAWSEEASVSISCSSSCRDCLVLVPDGLLGSLADHPSLLASGLVSRAVPGTSQCSGQPHRAAHRSPMRLRHACARWLATWRPCSRGQAHLSNSLSEAAVTASIAGFIVNSSQ